VFFFVSSEWKEFFSQFGRVVYCTVALDNEELVQALVKRRVLLQKASYRVPTTATATSSGSSSSTTGADGNAPLQAVPEPLQQSRLSEKIEESTAECQSLLEKKYLASEVFISFETERAQRAALKALCVGKVQLATNDTSALPDNCIFRGCLLLDVLEAKEPSVIRWKDLKTPLSVCLSLSIFIQIRILRLMHSPLISVHLLRRQKYCNEYAPVSSP